jgi:hypothetical protein
MINITSIGHDGVYILRQKSNNQPATTSLWVTSSRSSGILQGGKAPQHEASTGRVYVKVGVRVEEVFPSVYGLFWDLYEAFADVNPPPKPKRLKIKF